MPCVMAFVIVRDAMHAAMSLSEKPLDTLSLEAHVLLLPFCKHACVRAVELAPIQSGAEALSLLVLAMLAATSSLFCTGSVNRLKRCLLTGCPVAVANLWDVTDRDIDRFSQGVLAKWMNSDAEASTAQHSAQAKADCVSLSVSGSREACRLSKLIGAAPVCYGVPVCISSNNS